jgi:hypothetical protein
MPKFAYAAIDASGATVEGFRRPTRSATSRAT